MSISSSGALGTVSEDSKVKRIEAAADSIAHAQVTSGVTPGLTVAVARDGKTIFVRGYGKADLEKGTAAAPDTVYKIGSITKQFTAAVILRLAEAGRISLDDPITRFLPGYPTQGHLVTIRHLLNHTSGIRSFGLDEDNGQFFARDLTYAEIVDRFGRQPFDFKPGEKFRYNNTAYYLLGEIIARVTGTPYAEYIERDLLKPLGLLQTGYGDERRRTIPKLATGYDRSRDGKHARSPILSVHSIGAAGALCSTASDLIRWTHLLHTGKVVSPASLRQMTTASVAAEGIGGSEGAGYGLGAFAGSLEGHGKVYHGGTGLGFLSLVTYYPQDKLTVVVLMNAGTDRQKRDQMERTLARAALGIEIRDLPLTAAQMTRYEGDYILRSGGRTSDLRIFHEAGQLKAQLAGERVTRLLYQGEDRFVHGEDDTIRLAFSVENGRAEGVTVNLGSQSIPGKRRT